MRSAREELTLVTGGFGVTNWSAELMWKWRFVHQSHNDRITNGEIDHFVVVATIVDRRQ